MTTIEQYSKAEARQDAELPGLVLLLGLMGILAALVLAFA